MNDTLSFSSNKLNWQNQLKKELKGVSFHDLITEDRNGIKKNPFYVLEDILEEKINTRHENPDWEICAKILVVDATLANTQALDALKSGASGLVFLFPNLNKIPFNTLFKGIEIQYIYLHLIYERFDDLSLKSFLQYLDEIDLSMEALNISISYDPVSILTERGSFNNADFKKSFTEFFSISNISGKLCVNGTQYHNSGATSSYELACVLAHLNEYLHILNEEENIKFVQSIHISLAVGTDFFEQIAKLRAIRTLIACLTSTYGISTAVHLHIESSLFTIAQLDVNNNLLRNSISGMAAVLGNCDSLVINPYTSDGSEDFERRLALTQQILFKEEAHFNKVADVAAGSYFIESLTNSIAEIAWEHFQSIEYTGGLIRAFENNVIQKQISMDVEEFIQTYKDGKRIMVGVNKFINDKDNAKQQEPVLCPDQNILRKIVLADEILRK